ncbi:MAG: N-acetyltransferase [candidate division Zixibacteria bacterium]|nr:N-acetyltransferase [candidate division Zixibacteria bacterium]
MSEIKVVEVESSGQLRQFIEYPNRLYAGDPNYVTPLYVERQEFFDKKNNPFYRAARTQLFLAMRDDEVVGRIATCVSYRHNDYHEEKTGFFGFFDTPDDEEISRRLLKVAMIELKKAGMDRMRGPMNFSTNHECGFLVEGFDSPPIVMMTYNSPYQPRLAEKFGLKKVMDLLAYKLSTSTEPSERIRRVVESRLARTRVKIRPINMGAFTREVRLIREVYNQAWAKNWGFVPMDDDEFDHLAKNLKQILDPEIVCIAEHEGRAIGFSLALPDINQVLIRLDGRLFPTGLLKLLWLTKVRKSIDQCRLITFGVNPEYRKLGIDMMLYLETLRRGREKGYKWGELSWVLETNDLMRHGVEQMGAGVYKRYRIMEMPL